MLEITLETLPINKSLKFLKLEHGLTTKELADKIGISYHTLYKLEAGSKALKCSHKTTTKIAQAFNLDLALLMQTVDEYNAYLDSL